MLLSFKKFGGIRSFFMGNGSEFPSREFITRHLGTKCLFTTHSVFDRMTGLITPMHFPGDGNLCNVLMNTFSGCNTRTLVGRDGK